MKTLLKIALPLLVLALAWGAFKAITANPPEANRRAQPKPLPVSVAVLPVQRQNYQVQVPSQGSVQAGTTTELVAEVSGRIVRMSPQFRAGGRFAANQVIVELDSRDYEIALSSAKAAVTQAQAGLQEEQARGKAALRDWQRSGRGGKPNDLVLRIPQQRAAEAALASAKAQLKQAELNLSRTKIRAPYRGRVLQQRASVGQFVAKGATLGSVFDPATFEVRLPLSDQALQALDLAPLLQGRAARGPQVQLFRTEGEPISAFITALDSQIDTVTRQRDVIASVSAETVTNLALPLAIGQFVEARIAGRTLAEVFVLPERLVSAEQRVWMLEKGKAVQRQVSVVWSGQEQVVLDAGLSDGERVISTPLGNSPPGISVAVIDPNAPEATPKTDRSTGRPRSAEEQP